MVVVFLVPVLLGVGLARCAPPAFYVTARARPSCRSSIIPVALGTAVTLLLVNVFPGAARARHPDADGPAVRGQPRRCCCASSSPSGCCASSRCPTSPTSSRRCSRRSRRCCRRSGRARRCSPACRAAATGCTRARSGRRRWRSPCWSRAAHERWHFAGFSKAQEARKARFTQLRAARRARRARCRCRPCARQLLVKDLKVFLRDVSQWSQLLLLLALVLRLSLQLPRARSRAHPVHERRHQERLRVRQPRDGRAS